MYQTHPRGTVLCVAASQDALVVQVGAALACGNRVVVEAGMLDPLPSPFAGVVTRVADARLAGCDAVLFQGKDVALLAIVQAMAERDGGVVAVHIADPAGWYPLEFLVLERSVSTNTAAAGGNANLMMIG